MAKNELNRIGINGEAARRLSRNVRRHISGVEHIAPKVAKDIQEYALFRVMSVTAKTSVLRRMAFQFAVNKPLKNIFKADCTVMAEDYVQQVENDVRTAFKLKQ